MFSIFPFLLTFAGIAPFIIRISFGITTIYIAYKKLINKDQCITKQLKLFNTIEIILSIFIIIGLFTQLIALVYAIIFAIKLIHKASKKALLSDGINYYLLLFIMALSLVFTGAGLIAFDLPL